MHSFQSQKKFRVIFGSPSDYVVLQRISLKKVGRNSEPTQKQKCYCESSKELIKHKKHKYNHNLEIKQKCSFKEKQFEKSWTQ